MDEVKSLSEFITAESLSKHLGITRIVLTDWIHRGLPFIRVGRKLYFREASVATWLTTQERVSEDVQDDRRRTTQDR